MIERIGSLICYIVILIFLSTLLEMILPHGQFRRYLRMLVGILLILTLLSPLQNIVRLSPRWNIPVYLTAPSGKEELELILQQGERMREENLNRALENYRLLLFEVVKSLLEEEFDKELVELDLIIDEDPASGEFGAIKKMSVTARKKGEVLFGQKHIKEVNISIKRSENDRIPLNDVKGELKDIMAEKDVASARFLARYFLLPADRIEVRIIP